MSFYKREFPTERAKQVAYVWTNDLKKDLNPVAVQRLAFKIDAAIDAAVEEERAACAKVADDFACDCVQICECDYTTKIKTLILERGAP